MSMRQSNRTTRPRQRASRRNNRQIAISRNPAPNQQYAVNRPNEMKIILTYQEPFQAATTTGLNFDRVFNLNSAFDPYRTGTGHQPREFDQWAAIYGRYRVDRVDVTAMYTNTPSDGAICTLLASNDATNLTVLDDIIEQPFSVWKPFSAGGQGITLKKTYYLNEITGVQYATYRDDDRYQAVVSADPSEIIALHVGFWTRSSFTADFYVVLKQYITFFDPAYVAAS